jgi:chromosome partitioning protein
MSKVFVFTNHKGGVGKSTSATNIALGISGVLKQLNAPNARVLLIDTDSQGHATLVTTGRRDFGSHNSLYTVLTAERQTAVQTMLNCIVPSTWDADLHVLPASPMLESAERELIGVSGAPYRISDPLSKLLNTYAAVVIDTRPSFSLLTEMALIASTDALIPVEPRYLETVGLLSVVNKINEIRDGWRIPHLSLSGILITKMDSRVKGHAQLVEDLRTHPVLGKLICGVIPANEAVSYAHHNHESVFTYDPKAPASRAYAELVVSLVRRMTAQA